MDKIITPTVSNKQYNDLLAHKLQVEIRCKQLEILVRKLQKLKLGV